MRGRIMKEQFIVKLGCFITKEPALFHNWNTICLKDHSAASVQINTFSCASEG